MSQVEEKQKNLRIDGREHFNGEKMPLMKKKTKYNLVKTNKNNDGSGTYTKKPNPDCKKCPHKPPKSITRSSSSSSNSSS